MIFLVVASPCALAAAMMPTLLSALSNAARNGILFKGSAFVEALGKIDAIAFDKTGTLTVGPSGRRGGRFDERHRAGRPAWRTRPPSRPPRSIRLGAPSWPRPRGDS